MKRMIKLFDKLITEIIDKVRKAVIRLKMRLPCSKKKIKCNNMLLY